MWKGNRELDEFNESISASFASDLKYGGELFKDVNRYIMDRKPDEVEL
ncbi:MAG: hypothetical protein GXP63_06240 [DPANN group archaeon]|nr:hypothetical protein [DPANN group archaeon]